MKNQILLGNIGFIERTTAILFGSKCGVHEGLGTNTTNTIHIAGKNVFRKTISYNENKFISDIGSKSFLRFRFDGFPGGYFTNNQCYFNPVVSPQEIGDRWKTTVLLLDTGAMKSYFPLQFLEDAILIEDQVGGGLVRYLIKRDLERSWMGLGFDPRINHTIDPNQDIKPFKINKIKEIIENKIFDRDGVFGEGTFCGSGTTRGRLLRALGLGYIGMKMEIWDRGIPGKKPIHSHYAGISNQEFGVGIALKKFGRVRTTESSVPVSVLGVCEVLDQSLTVVLGGKCKGAFGKTGHSFAYLFEKVDGGGEVMEDVGKFVSAFLKQSWKKNFEF